MQAQATRTGNGMAVAGFVCALVGIFLFQFILGPLGIIFGAIGWARANSGAPRKGLAVAGVIIGILDLAILIVVLAAGGGHFSYHIGK
jgi:hypothetical protein